MSRVRLARDVAVFTGSSLVVQALGLGLAFYLRRVLGPEAMGVWALLQVLNTYIAYTNLGIVAGVCREIPVLRAAGGQEARIESLKNGAYTYISFVATLTAGALFLAALFLRPGLSPEVFWGLLALGAMTHLDRKNSYRLQILYSEKRFDLASRFRTLSALVNAGLLVPLVWRYGLYGFFAANLLSFLFNAYYLTRVSHIHFRSSRDLGEILAVLKFGLPMFFLGFGVSFLNSMDKVSIGKFLGLRELGIYSVAMMASSYVFMLPNMFQVVLLPWTLEKFGKQEDAASRLAYATVPGRLMVVYFSLFIGVLWIFGPALFERLLPAYLEGVPAMKAALFGACFMALSQQMSHIVLGYKRHGQLLPYLAVFSLGVFGLSYGWVRAGGGVLELSLVMAAAQLLFYLVTWCVALSGTFTAGRAVLELALNLTPLALSGGALCTLDVLWPGTDPARTLVRAVSYLAVWAAILLVFERRVGSIRLAQDLVRAWVSRKRVAGA